MKLRFHTIAQRTISSLVALAMLISLCLPITTAWAADSTNQNQVVVSIEKSNGNGTSTFLLLPTVVNYSGSITALKAFNQAYGEGSVTEGLVKNDIKVKDPTFSGGWLSDNGKSDAARWLVLFDSAKGEGVWNRLGNSAKNGSPSVIRLVYTTNNGEDVGYASNKLSVSKDKLYLLMAQVDQKKLESDAVLKNAWLAAKNAATKNNPSQAELDNAAQRLDAVLHPSVPAQSVSISPSSLDLIVGQSSTATAAVTPSNTTDTITWKSLNSNIATVTQNGKITALSSGTATIQATAGNVSDTIHVNVSVPTVTDLTLDKTSAELTAGESLLLNATVTPDDASNQLTWTSKDPSIATVNQFGMVVAQSAGSTQIIAKAGSKQVACSVTVKEKQADTTPTIYFKHSDGRLQPLTNDSISLTLLDEGSFILKGYNGDVSWRANDGTRTWVSSKGMLFAWNTIDHLTGNVYSADSDTPLKTFTISVKSVQIDDLKLFANDQELSADTPFMADGSSHYQITAKARVKGTSYYVDVPNIAFTTTVSDSKTGWTDSDNNFGVNSDKSATFTVKMADGSAQASFTAQASSVEVTDIAVNLPDTWQIDGWNGLADQYSGIQIGIGNDYSVQVLPTGASNRTVKWESLTPDIAEYQATFNNGIVPKKAGTAKFRVSSVANPEISKEFSVTFTYRYPLQSVSMENTNLTITKGEVQKLQLNVQPGNATEQRFNWTYSTPGIVEVSDSISRDTNNINNPLITTHTMYAKSEGTVTVTGTPLDNTANAKPIVFTVTVTVTTDQQSGNDNLLEQTNAGIAHGLAYLTSDHATRNQYGDEWTIFSILRSGGTIPQNELDAYYASVCKTLQTDSASLKPTDRGRLVITLLAMGKDPTNVGGVNLIEQLYNDSKLTKYSSNMAMWTLIALDANNYTVPDDALWNRQTLIDMILPYQKEDGGFGLTTEAGNSVDITAMAIQALAKYQQQPKVADAMQKALTYLKDKQTYNAGFMEGGSENSCSAAQVLTALTAAGINPLEQQNGFVYGKNNIVSNLLQFQVENGFKTYLNSSDEADSVKLMSSQQVTFALESYRRLLNGENSIFDLTDVKVETGGDNSVITTPTPSTTPEPTATPVPTQQPTSDNTGSNNSGNDNGGTSSQGGSATTPPASTAVPTPAPTKAPSTYIFRNPSSQAQQPDSQPAESEVPTSEDSSQSDAPAAEIPVINDSSDNSVATANSDSGSSAPVAVYAVAGVAGIAVIGGAGVFAFRRWKL